jgi:hypothetical protein
MKKIWNTAMAAMMLAGSFAITQAQESAALVDKLVEKGVLSESEGDEVKASLSSEVASSGYGKMDAGKLAKKITLFGDLRMRYEYGHYGTAAHDYPTTPNATAAETLERQRRHYVGGSTNTLFEGADNGSTTDPWDRSRVRYRLRFGMKVDFSDNLEMGFRLATGSTTDGRSTNQDLGNVTAGNNPAWSADTITVDQAYLKWKPWEPVTLIGGKYEVHKSIVTSDMMFDSDLNAEGFTQQFTYKPNDNLTLFANTVQWVFGEVTEQDTDTSISFNRNAARTRDASAAVRVDDGWLFGGQVGAKWEFVPKRTHAQIVAGYWNYTNAGDIGSTTENIGQANAVGNGAFQITKANLGSEFQIVDLLGEIKYTPSSGFLKDVPITPYFHMAWNTAPSPDYMLLRSNATGYYTLTENGDDNIEGPGSHNTGKHTMDLSSDLAWRVGLKVGEAKKAGQWEINTYYQEVGSDAVPTGLVDSDFAGGNTNNAGVVVKGVYAFRDWWTFGVTYMDSRFLNENQAAMYGQTYTADNQLFQLDTVVKF